MPRKSKPPKHQEISKLRPTSSRNSFRGIPTHAFVVAADDEFARHCWKREAAIPCAATGLDCSWDGGRGFSECPRDGKGARARMAAERGPGWDARARAGEGLLRNEKCTHRLRLILKQPSLTKAQILDSCPQWSCRPGMESPSPQPSQWHTVIGGPQRRQAPTKKRCG